MDTETANRAATDAPVGRRDFLKKAIAAAIGGLVTAVPAAAGLLAFVDPLRRRGSAGGNSTAGFTDVAPLSAVPADGMPRRFAVMAERVDAWTKHPAAQVGAVYLKRDKLDPQKVTAFNVVCPHAGCPVELAEHGAFFCPCHNSKFHPDGAVVQGQCVSPRGLDSLDVDPGALKAGTIRVRFQNFVAGTHDKIPTT